MAPYMGHIMAEGWPRGDRMRHQTNFISTMVTYSTLPLLSVCNEQHSLPTTKWRTKKIQTQSKAYIIVHTNVLFIVVPTNVLSLELPLPLTNQELPLPLTNQELPSHTRSSSRNSPFPPPPPPPFPKLPLTSPYPSCLCLGSTFHFPSGKVRRPDLPIFLFWVHFWVSFLIGGRIYI